MTKPKIAIVVLHWGDPDDTKALLQSLRVVEYQPFDIWLVDQTNSLSVDLPPNAKLLRPKANLGFSGGNNLALRQIVDQDYAYALMLNNDTLVRPDFLDHLVKALEANPRAAAAGPTILYQDPPDDTWYAGGRLSLRRGKVEHIGMRRKFDPLSLTPPQPTQFITGCCMMLRTEALRDLGLLDDRYFVYWEDADWCARAARAGHQLLYVPHAIIRHKISPGLGYDTPTYHYYIFRNNLLFIRNHVSWGWKPLATAVLTKRALRETAKLFLRHKKDYVIFFKLTGKSVYHHAIRRYGRL